MRIYAILYSYQKKTDAKRATFEPHILHITLTLTGGRHSKGVVWSTPVGSGGGNLHGPVLDLQLLHKLLRVPIPAPLLLWVQGWLRMPGLCGGGADFFL